MIGHRVLQRSEIPKGVMWPHMIGEGCFHQLHGGTKTNVSMEERNISLDKYRQQFEAIRGHGDVITKKTFLYGSFANCCVKNSPRTGKK